ncbi:MAG: LPS export ABC transporter permease LptF [Pseudomonadota bacterium]
MARFDRYMLSQLLVLFGFFSLILVLVYWVNQAVALFDQLIADGQSARVFFEFTALSLPNIIRLVLPVAAFTAVIYVTNRMSNESELTVVQATGYSRLRLARPVLVFGLLVALMMGALMHFLVPVSLSRLAERETEVSENLSARLLRAGVFIHTGSDATFYLREISPDGVLEDVFLFDETPGVRNQIYTADRAFLVRAERGPQLVLIDGQAQTLDLQTGRMVTTTFNDFVIGVEDLLGDVNRPTPRLRELSTWRLLFPSGADMALTNKGRASFAQEAHERLSQPLFSVVSSLLAFAVLMSGGFSRFGIWRQIIIAVLLLVAFKVLEGMAAQAIGRSAAAWPLAYLPALIGGLTAYILLKRSQRERRVKLAPEAAVA